MEFLIKAVTLAVSIVASVFSSGDRPKTQLPQIPVVAEHRASLPKSTELTSLPRRAEEGAVHIVLRRARREGEPIDPETLQFLAQLKSRQSTKQPLKAAPWFAEHEETVTAKDVFQTLVSDQ